MKKFLKRISIITMIMCIILVNNNSIFAKTEKEVLTEKATVLQELEILKGNGVSLDLDGQLSRSQAAAFIVRLLCEEDEVTNNKLKYIDTKFSDVPKDQWYAPYIGYCVEKNIIDGYPDNTFKPNDKLGEKAFLKLVLTGLGYKYNDDFTWNNVFEYAYGAGLVKDLSYAGGYVESSKYNRGNVVRVLHTALQLVNQNTNVRMIQKFVDNNIISKKDAIDYKLLDDELETKIVSVIPINATTIEVKFNENVQTITPENLLLYKTNDTSQVLPISDVAKKESADTYTITVNNKQEIDEEYTLLIDRVIDVKGNPTTSFSEEFLGYRADEVESDYFMISRVKPISNNVIYVYFTQPINDNALQAGFYSLQKNKEEVVKGSNQDIMISKLSTCDNGISIYFKNYIFTAEEYFELVIDGNLSSKYAVRLNDGQGDSVKFKASTQANMPLNVDSCIPLNSHTIQLTFNKQVNPTLAKQVFMYCVTDSDNKQIKINKATVINEGDNAGKVVRLTIESVIKINKVYKVMVNHMTDITSQFQIMLKEYTFSGSYYSTNDIKIEAVLPIDENLLLLYLNKSVDQESAEIVSNYQIHGVSNSNYIAIPSAVYYNKSEDPQIIKIYLSESNKLKPSDVYNFKVLTSLKDEMGNFQSSIKTKQFTHSSTQAVDVYISDAKVIGDNTIKLSFNKEIAFDINNILTTNYTLTYVENGMEYNKIPVGATYIDPQTIILKFDFIEKDKSYKVNFKKLVDYGKNETSNFDNRHTCDVEIGE
ncbi:S-layer homology domain-containing protein [Vallitalea guaymasensis]|uniref:S-layer homology domain-containing protein n=1 Tax=Vallitalea guaymasensis TaxID=1185412 RepID=UPI000DE3F048|nr:S-layer homology domain-containing protein [Vallitalea guaymasensis]